MTTATATTGNGWMQAVPTTTYTKAPTAWHPLPIQNSPFGGGTALNPDNWLISPAFTAGSTVTFWYAGQDPSYSAEPFGVYVIANGTTSDELGHFTASNTYQQGSVDISAYAGQTVQVAFRHYGVTDMFRLNLDLVEVSGGGSTPNTPVPPTQNPNTPAPGGMATITLTAGDVFSDGSGYQMLLDADATAFGNEIPAEGPLTQSGNAPAGLYDAFEYKIPVNADGSTTTSNVVVNNSVTIQVPAGTYDWCLTNPTPGDRIWIASSQGNVGGRADDYTFEAGYTYNFTVYLLGQNDATDVEIIPGGGNTPEPPTENPVTPAPGGMATISLTAGDVFSRTVPVTRCSSMQMQPHSAMRSPQKVLSPWAAMHPQVCTMHSSIRFP